MKPKRIIYIILLCILFLIIDLIFVRKENEYKEEGKDSGEYDRILNHIGTPKEQIDKMGYEFKEYVCNNMEQDEKFEFYNPYINLNYGSKTIRCSYIVTIFTTSCSKEKSDGNRIYFSFKWLRPVALFSGGDAFFITLYSGWMIKTDEELPVFQLRQGRCGEGEAFINEYAPGDVGMLGFTFDIPFSFDMKALTMERYYRGYTNFYVKENTNNERDKDGEKYLTIGCSFRENMKSENIQWGVHK